MNRLHLFLVAGFITLFLNIPTTALAEPILPVPEKVSDHVYAWIGPFGPPNKSNQGYRMNLAFVVGTEAVAVLDTGYTRAMGEEIIAHIRKVTALPIRYAVNTNSQPHRHFGNEAFKAVGAKIIATPEEVERMDDMGGMFALSAASALGLKQDAVTAPDAPDTLIDAERVLDLGGGVKVTLKPAGANHTPNSLYAVIEADKVIYASDLLYSGRLLAVLDVSSPSEWLKGYDALRVYKGYTFVPGHGRPAPLSAFEFPTYSYLTLLNDHMTKAVEDGVELGDALKSLDQSEFAELGAFEMLAGPNSNWAYLRAELDGF
ncbi:MAG: MBL fold metallo-hydrolase [Alphaproteobacteria bacterium]